MSLRKKARWGKKQQIFVFNVFAFAVWNRFKGGKEDYREGKNSYQGSRHLSLLGDLVPVIKNCLKPIKSQLFC